MKPGWLLRTRFHARPGQPDNFDVLTPDAIRGFIDQVLGMIAAIVVPVTCISLVVGGIVIMNIMLVSVTERTREIGMRKALGARHGDVMMQILIEAVVLASVGGAVGVALGALVTAMLGKVFELSLHITAGYVALSLVVSSLVGHHLRLVSGVAGGQTRSGGGAARGVTREHQPNPEHANWPCRPWAHTASARCSPCSAS